MRAAIFIPYHQKVLRTPLLSIDAFRSKEGHKLGIDIGGGTTDIMVYNRTTNENGTVANHVSLASSFRFAGMHMYAAAGGTVTNKDNIWYKALDKAKILSKIKSVNERNGNITYENIILCAQIATKILKNIWLCWKVFVILQSI